MAGQRIVLTEQQRSDLLSAAESSTTSTRMATRARIVLALEQQWKLKDVAKALGVSTPTVALWRNRFLENGIEGLADRNEHVGSDVELTRLLDAAERTVSRRGFCQTRISDIAFEAGVSTSLIMYYFESRQETLVRAMLHANRRAAVRFEDELVGGSQAAVVRLAAFMQRIVPVKGSRLDVYLLELDLLAHARQYPEFITIWDEHQSRWIAGLASIIRDGVTEKVFREPEAGAHGLAQNALAMIDGFGFQVGIGSSLVTRALMITAITGYMSAELGIDPALLRSGGKSIS